MSFAIRKKILQGDELWEHYYVTMGNARSLDKLAEWATKQWGNNPNTRVGWTKGGVQQAMWFWCFKNCFKDNNYCRNTYAEASAIYRDYKPMEDEEWFETLSNRAHAYYTPKQYQKYLRQHPELKSYEIV